MKDFYNAAAYDAQAEGIPGDVEFYTRLALEAHGSGHPVLELACGTGRVTIPVAREGVRVVGLDRSPAMLGRAREKGAGLENVRWVEGNMREFHLEERFGLVFIPYRSFLHLLTVEDQFSCLRCIHRHLAAGGRLALNIFNPDIAMMGRWLSGQRGGLHRRGDRYTHPESGNEVARWETRQYRPASQEVESTFLDEELDDHGMVTSRIYNGLRLRYVFRYEMEHLFARTGFDVESLYGDLFGAEFVDASSEMVWVARKAQ